MKQIFSLTVIITLAMYSTNVNATIRRVGNPGPKTALDYSDLQTAEDSCSYTKVDTILLYPNPNFNAPWQTGCDKKIVFIGYGYYLDTVSLGTGANTNLQSIIGRQRVIVSLLPGSDGCEFQGIDSLELYTYFSPINNILVKRCNLNMQHSFSILTNWAIVQSIVKLDAQNQATLSKVFISNCIIANFSASYNAGQSGIIQNCVFTAGWEDPSFVFKNNIFLLDYDGPLNSSSKYTYNVFVGNVTGVNNTNKKNQAANSICIGYPNQSIFSNDKRWQLKAGSPAIGAGEGGIDCGIYAVGSPYPYVPSGIPAIPSFYLLDAPSLTGTEPTYQIIFSVKSNN